MAFGFSAKVAGRTPVGAVSTKKTVPKSVQDIIDRATASAYLPNYGTPGAALPGSSITPAGQTNTYPGAYATGAGMGVGPTAAGGTTPGGVGSSYTAPAASGSGGAGLGQNGTDAYSGWMSRFNPGDFKNEVFNDPQIVLNRMFHDLGLNTSSPSYSNLRSLNGVDPMSLYMLTNPTTPAGSLNDQGYGNFLHTLWANQMAPGGRSVNFNEAMANLRGQGDQSSLDPSKQSALYQQLTRGGAPEQFRAYYGLAQDAAKMGLPPAIASAFLDALARQGDTYLSGASQSSGGNVPSFYKYATNPMG